MHLLPLLNDFLSCDFYKSATRRGALFFTYLGIDLGVLDFPEAAVLMEKWKILTIHGTQAPGHPHTHHTQPHLHTHVAPKRINEHTQAHKHTPHLYICGIQTNTNPLQTAIPSEHCPAVNYTPFTFDTYMSSSDRFTHTHTSHVFNYSNNNSDLHDNTNINSNDNHTQNGNETDNEPLELCTDKLTAREFYTNTDGHTHTHTIEKELPVCCWKLFTTAAGN
eukprot:GHVR01133553.1.p1 GENE.GHVR01133553.1~~GHVR01133553.1.p1  ORF type:complete len:221 (-),score=53.06 GHVR01133553.1:174-836(-)